MNSIKKFLFVTFISFIFIFPLTQLDKSININQSNELIENNYANSQVDSVSYNSRDTGDFVKVEETFNSVDWSYDIAIYYEGKNTDECRNSVNAITLSYVNVNGRQRNSVWSDLYYEYDYNNDQCYVYQGYDYQSNYREKITIKDAPYNEDFTLTVFSYDSQNNLVSTINHTFKTEKARSDISETEPYYFVTGNGNESYESFVSDIKVYDGMIGITFYYNLNNYYSSYYSTPEINEIYLYDGYNNKIKAEEIESQSLLFAEHNIESEYSSYVSFTSYFSKSKLIYSSYGIAINYTDINGELQSSQETGIISYYEVPILKIKNYNLNSSLIILGIIAAIILLISLIYLTLYLLRKNKKIV